MRMTIMAALLLAGCGDRQPVPTQAENRQLDEAANRLDTAPDSLEAIDENALEPDNRAE